MNKDNEIDIENTIHRIHKMQRDRAAMLVPVSPHKEILNSIDEQQSRGRAIRVLKSRLFSPEMLHIDLNTISMVSDPEPDCGIKDEMAAFDYAMKLVE